MAAKEHKTQFLKDYRPTWYKVASIEMWFDFNPDVTRVRSKLNISPAMGTPPGEPLELDGEELELVSVAVDGVALASSEYRHDERGFTLKAPPEKAFELAIEVNIKPEINTKLMGLYRTNDIWTTQCEAEGFRRISFMYDRPDVMATYRVHMEADKDLAPVLLSNGNLVESGQAKGGRHFAIWDDPHPKPTYLFAVVAGNLDRVADQFTTISGRKVKLGVYCEPGKADKCGYAMDVLKRSMKWDEERFGREYDLDVFNIVAVSDFNSGAMENKGLNIFNDKYILADAQSATDLDYYNIERIVAHEYFHNWTGNRVTCRDWFQLSLKEGLTVYRDQEFTSDVRSRPVKRIGDARSLRAGQFPEDAGPLAHPPRPDNYAEIDNFYTATVYNKGAEIVRMLATLLGREGFRKGTDLYFERHDGEATTIESWIKVFEDSSGRDFSQFINWYKQAGTPEVGAAGVWNEQAKTYVLSLSQHTAPTPGQPEKGPMYIPLKFGLVGPNGKDISYDGVSGCEVVDDVIILDCPSAEILFEGVGVRPVLSLLREFSAPVKLDITQSEDDQLFLAQHDNDPFNRWQASQGLATKMMARAASGKGLIEPAQIDALSQALENCLVSSELDPAFKALVLTLPDEGAVRQEIGNNINPADVHKVRRELLAEVSLRLKKPLLQTYEELSSEGTPSQDAIEVNNRSLRNRCLGLFVAGHSELGEKLASAHYYDANNITDRMSALETLVINNTPLAQEHMEHFQAHYCQDPLINDKWLMLNGLFGDEGCIDRLKTLYQSETFPKTNPNRLRALMGGLIYRNLAQFTRLDGAGFDFAAHVAEEIDPINPHISSSIMEAFAGWRTWEPNRAAMAKQILQTLAQHTGNSRDLADILARSLAV